MNTPLWCGRVQLDYPSFWLLFWGGNSIDGGCLGFCVQRGCIFGGCIGELADRNVGVSWDPLHGDVPATLIQADFELVDFNAGSQESFAWVLAVGGDQAFLSECQVLVAPI